MHIRWRKEVEKKVYRKKANACKGGRFYETKEKGCKNKAYGGRKGLYDGEDGR